MENIAPNAQNKKFDPKMQKLNPMLAEKISSFFGESNTEVDISDIRFDINF